MEAIASFTCDRALKVLTTFRTKWGSFISRSVVISAPGPTVQSRPMTKVAVSLLLLLFVAVSNR